MAFGQSRRRSWESSRGGIGCRVVGIVIGVIVGVITAPPSDPYDLGGDPHGVWILASALFGGGIGFAVGCLARVAWLVWQSLKSSSTADALTEEFNILDRRGR